MLHDGSLQTPNSNRQAWNRLVDVYSDCQECSLHKTRHTVVMGEGYAPSSILIIGEAPGHDEDWSGRPFQGRSGKLLRKFIAEAGITDRFITNVLACRPPDNRTPMDHEIQACLPRLMATIHIVEPRVILLVGKTAVHSLFYNSDMKTARRKARLLKYRCDGKSRAIPTTACYHPAYILRNPDEMDDFRLDLRFAVELLT